MLITKVFKDNFHVKTRAGITFVIWTISIPLIVILIFTAGRINKQVELWILVGAVFLSKS